jgi:hypothetical protein
MLVLSGLVSQFQLLVFRARHLVAPFHDYAPVAMFVVKSLHRGG